MQGARMKHTIVAVAITVALAVLGGVMVTENTAVYRANVVGSN